MIYPPDMDPECVALCNALNALPGVRTTESCCGHGQSEFVVFFIADTIMSLCPIVNAVRSSAWHVEAWRTGRAGKVCFVLEGPIGSSEMLGGANDLAEWLTVERQTMLAREVTMKRRGVLRSFFKNLYSAK